MESFERIDIPHLDIKGIYTKERENLQCIADNLFKASDEFGIVALQNHGISLEGIRSLFCAADKFFDMPHDIKMKYKRSLQPFHGYAEEIRTIGGDSFLMNESFDTVNFELQFPDDELPEFKEITSEVYNDFFILSEKMLKVFDLAFESGDYFLKNHVKGDPENPLKNMKVLRYPKVDPKIPSGAIRLNEHFDIGIFTFLFTMEGLQIQSANGEWKTAKIPSDTILMLYGQALEQISSDRLRAPNHRVVVTEGEKLSQNPRKALAFFQGLSGKTIVKSLDGSNKYPPIPYSEFMVSRIKMFYRY